MIEATTSTLVDVDAQEAVDLLLRDLHSSHEGLSSNEARRRLLQNGSNELTRRGGPRWPAELGRQLAHPLALLLWLAAALSFAIGNQTLAIAVLLVIVLNAAFAFVQEMQAEKAVEALARYMPNDVNALRDGERRAIDAATLVPGDVVLVAEGDRIAADMRLLSGTLEVDLSTLTGESVPAVRSAELRDVDVPRIAARDLVFGGTSATAGEARAVVFATGMRTELGRIAALSQRVKEEPSPLEGQVRRVAWLIAVIAVAMAVAFVPIAILLAGLSLKSSIVFAVGLLAGNVPEGLLPVITLALAVAVTVLARRGALVKRLAAVETLGSTDVICTDKTGTLTENRMSPIAAWTLAGEVVLSDASGAPGPQPPALRALRTTALACNVARLGPGGVALGDPTELAVLRAAAALGADTDTSARHAGRRNQYNFDPSLKLMSTLDAVGTQRWVNTKGAPEAVLARCTTALDPDGRALPLGPALVEEISSRVEHFAAEGLRVLAFARKSINRDAPRNREQAESELCFLGLITMLDPPRAGVAEAVARCHEAGIRIIVITGDHPLTAAAVARQTGIGGEHPRTVDAQRFDHRRESEIEETLKGGEELIFARASPEAKLQIAEALRRQGHVIAMTGDGVNDAPALRSADIGVAMGRSGTDVSREAATMVLTDDNFATIVVAIEAGRRVYDNVRKFIVYIFAHTTPEVVPFLIFAFSGGSVPLALPVLLLLSIDVGTETLPSLALGREPAEPDLMSRPPRRREDGVIRRPMLLRSWLFLGALTTVLSLGVFFIVLGRAGWHPGDSVASGSRLHHAYLQATTMTFLAIVAGQIGSAFAARTERSSLRSVGFFSNRYLLLGILGELALAAAIVYAPPLQSLFASASPPARDLLLLAPCPAIVWGADEMRRLLVRRRRAHSLQFSPLAVD